MKKLPVDVQTFQTMREDGYLYIDKTRFIHRMVEEGRFFFLSRSRRFGKSLTASMLDCLFRGGKKLFEGLWIVERGNWEMRKDVKRRLYTLGYPNNEVKISFLEILLVSYGNMKDGEEKSRFLLLSEYLSREDLEAFFETVRAFFASISYSLVGKLNEAWFQTLFYLMAQASGVNVRNEVLTIRGRIDLVVEFRDKTFILEFKCNQSAGAAIKEIHEKGYPEKLKRSGKTLMLVGVNFDSEKRNAADWKVEKG